MSKNPNIFHCILFGLSARMSVLVNENLSLMDVKIQKASLYGPEYFKTTECKAIDLRIAINEIRISLYKSILKIK